MLNEDEHDRAVRIEAQAILRHAAVCDLKACADEVASMYRNLEATSTLDGMPTLDTEPRAREQQLILLWLVERRFRFRLQDNLRGSLEMLGGEPVVDRI